MLKHNLDGASLLSAVSISHPVDTSSIIITLKFQNSALRHDGISSTSTKWMKWKEVNHPNITGKTGLK